MVAPSEALPPCENIPPKVGKFGALGGVPDNDADTWTLPGSTIDRLLLHIAKRADREAALERCARSRGLLPDDPGPLSSTLTQ